MCSCKQVRIAVVLLAVSLSGCGGRDGEVPAITTQAEPQPPQSNVEKQQEVEVEVEDSIVVEVPEVVPPVVVVVAPPPESEPEDLYPFPEEELIECGLDYQAPECIHRNDDGSLLDPVDWLREFSGQCVEFGWHPPSARYDGTYMPTEEIDYYVVVMEQGDVYDYTPYVLDAMTAKGSVIDRLANGDPMVVYVPNSQTDADCTLLGFGLGPVDRWFSVVAVDIYGNESVPSDAHRLTDYAPSWIPQRVASLPNQ